jgi:acetyl esterase/lipase
MAWAVFAVGLVLALLTIPALVPLHHWAFLFPAFLVSWLGTGFAGWWLVITPLALSVPVASGGLSGWPGWAGLALGAVAIAGLLYQRALARRSARAFDRVLTPLDRETRRRARRRAISVLAPFWMGHRSVECVRDLRYAEGAGRRHLLDVYKPRPPVERAPVLLQIHGGAWTIGAKNTQGRPLMQALASAGWVCVAINYRLSPRSKFPDHLVDCKLALRWIRRHIAEHGGDPGRVVVTGGSAGAHLAAMVALTANDPRYQQGFEDVDTSVVGCVPMYGPYALDEIFGPPRWSRIGRRVAGHMGALVLGENVADDPRPYRTASPMHAVRSGAPPFLVVHGTIDNLVPVEQARRFTAALRDVGTHVTYVELPGAPHAFDIFHSEWADAAVSGVARWLSWLLARDVAEQSEDVDTAATDPTTMARTAPS